MTNILKTSVAQHGLTAMIQRLGRDCSPTQFVREFTMNSIEAIQRRKGAGGILIDVNWEIFDEYEVHKISFTDNGDGMTADEMLQHLNNLSSSGPIKNAYENYGMGAKIAALTRNHAGIIYDSWKSGEGNRIIIHYDDQERAYGVKPVSLPDGTVEWFTPLDDAAKPQLITDNGTRVTLLGMSFPEEDTMMPPADTKGGKENWLYQYLNTKFFQIPDEIEIQARIGYYRDPENKKHNYLRNVKGQKATLDGYAESSGRVQLSDAVVHWWILESDRSGHGREYIIGHTGCVHQNEMFDLADGRSSRAHGFGVIFGREDVVLYVEPSSGYTQDTTRTRLRQIDGSELPWARWYDEFRSKLPPELDEFMKKRMNAAENKSHSDSIRERLKNIREFFKISRYKASKSGNQFADPESETTGKTGSVTATVTRSGGGYRRAEGGKGPGVLDELLLSVRKESGVSVVQLNPDQFPEVKWISIMDKTRAIDELDDRAAEYIEKDNLIVANADFQGITDIVKYFVAQFSDIDDIGTAVREEVQEAFEQQLIEVVTGALSFKNRPKWNPDQFASAVSQEALTAAVMTRYHLINQIRRSLGNRLKNASKAAQTA